jgi:uncharacterized protein (DUF1015 family)
VSGLAQVTSPPYDVIAADYETRLMAADPHNVVRLILPLHTEGQSGSPYEAAAADLASWLADGILAVDADPALYVYEQADAERIVQRGLIGALGLVPYAAGIVQPHENVMPGPVAGRRQLMEVTQANLEPIFLLYQGENGMATKLVDAVADGRVPLAETVTSDGLRHRLWAVAEPAELAAIAADLAPRTALIADGHHRYAAYLQLQRLMREADAGPGPWDRGLALLVDSAAYPPHVGAIHRVVEGLVPATAARLAGAAFTVRELPGGAADITGALAELDGACAGGVAFLLAGRGRAWLLTDPDPARLRAAMSDEPAGLWQRLGGAVMSDLLFGRLWGVQDDERSVRAFHDGAEAIRAVDNGTAGGTAVLCCPLSADQVYQVAALGRRVPRKSTSFGPKPRTGMVMRMFAQG